MLHILSAAPNVPVRVTRYALRSAHCVQRAVLYAPQLLATYCTVHTMHCTTRGAHQSTTFEKIETKIRRGQRS